WNCEGRSATLDVASRPSQRCMSSLRKSSRVRPKSPPLHTPSESASESNRAGDMNRIGGNVSGMALCLLLSAATATAARGGALFRPAVVAGFVALAFDADDRKDQDGARRTLRRADHARAQPPRSRFRRKFDDGPHAHSLWLSPLRMWRHFN